MPRFFLRFFLTALIFLLVGDMLYAQPVIQWEKSLGGKGREESSCIIKTSDGGYAAIGFTSSNDGDVSGLHNTAAKDIWDVWLVKLDGAGILQWQKALGGSSSDVGICVIQTSDGGYCAAGQTNSHDGDIKNPHPSENLWVVKLDNAGVIQWEKTYGGTCGELANSVIQTTDGGYAIAGVTCSKNGDVTGIHGLQDYWVLKLNSDGTIQWEKTFGGTQGDQAYSIVQTTDGGYAVVGWTFSNDGDVSGNHSLGDPDIWLVKLSSSGTIQWQKTYGGSQYDLAYSLIQTTDGGFAIAGSTNSGDGDVTGYHPGGFDIWVLKLTGTGAIEWQKTLGGVAEDQANSIIQTTDGGFAIAGRTKSANGDVTAYHGGYDMWIVKLTSAGAIDWQKTLGGSADEQAFSIVETANNEYAVAGWTNSSDGEVTGNHGGEDFWIVKLAPPPVVDSLVTGVINTYTNGVAVDTCHNEIVLASTSGFNSGMRILIIQMKGAVIDESNSSTFGNIIDPLSAGKYEFATISGVTPTTITLQNKLLNVYDASGIVQIVTVASYTDVTIAGTVKAKPFDGNTGGIVVLEASGAVRLNADIDVSGFGSRGGDASDNGGSDSKQDYYYTRVSGNGGLKGEGVANSKINYEAGRGAIANGGGGGNARNAGGAGGASAGIGGNGGDQLNQFSRLPIGGIGGFGLPHSLLSDHLFMGGGGGGGQENDNKGSSGAHGGGIVIIRAKEIQGNGFTIRANGSNAASSFGDGAGGGGAGGTIILDAPIITGTLGIEAFGGKGGDADEQNQLTDCYGPGGGGGGGVVASSAQTSFPLTTAMCNGGNSGKDINTTGPCNGTAYGASSGSAGAIVPKGAVIQEASVQFATPKITTISPRICQNDSAKIEASGGDTYLWSPATGLIDPRAAVQLVSPKTSTTYSVAITKGDCIFIDSVVVTIDSASTPAVIGNNMVCSGDTITLSTDKNYSSYLWSTGEVTQNIKVWQAGNYSVSVKNSSGCSGNSTAFNVGIYPTPNLSISASHMVLTDPNDKITLIATPGFKIYQWSTKETTDSIIVSAEGTYSLSVIDSNGCSAMASIEIQSAASAASVDLILPIIAAAPGDHVMLPVNILASKNLDKSGATDFTYTIRFNRSLLVPVDQSIPSVTNGRERTLTISAKRPDVLTTGALAQIEFIATLGDATSTPIYFDSISWLNGKPVQTIVSSGTFNLLGICPQGGNRLFSPDGVILLQSARPNPASTSTTIDYQLLEEGQTKLLLMDMLGRLTKTIVDSHQVPGTYHTIVDVSQLSDGMYTCILQTPSQCRTFRMEVFH